MSLQTSTSHYEVKTDGRPLSASLRQSTTEIVLDQRFMQPASLMITIFGLRPDVAATSGLKAGAMLQLDVHTKGKVTGLFKGTITTIEFDGSEIGTLCRIRAYDDLHRLTGGRTTRTFQQQKTSDIITKVIGDAGLKATVSSTITVHDHVIQMDESDYDFIVRLARNAGLVVLVEGKDVVVKPVPTAKGSSQHSLRAAPKALQATVDLNVKAWRCRATQTEAVTKVVVGGWDPVAARRIEAQTAPDGSIIGTGPKPTGRGTLHIPTPLTTESAAKERAAGAALHVGAVHTELSIELDGDPSMTAGAVVAFGKVGKPFDGAYVATHVVHRFDLDGYTTEAECATLGDRSALGTITGSVDAADHRWGGAVVGVVTNVQDPKKQGRVKIKYPWLPTDPESDWARVIHHGAGASQKGLLILPAVNDEVLVVFEHGSPDHPVVLGGTFNGKAKPADPTYTQQEVAGHVWRSASGHEIALWDEKGKEAIKIISGDKDVSVTIDKAKSAVTVETKKSKVDVKAGGPVTVESKQDIKLSGTNVTVEAKAGLKLKGATAELSASGPVTVKGAVIKLN